MVSLYSKGHASLSAELIFAKSMDFFQRDLSLSGSWWMVSPTQKGGVRRYDKSTLRKSYVYFVKEIPDIV